MSILALLICGLGVGSVPAGLAAGCRSLDCELLALAGGLSLLGSSKEAFRNGEMATGSGACSNIIIQLVVRHAEHAGLFLPYD